MHPSPMNSPRKSRRSVCVVAAMLCLLAAVPSQGAKNDKKKKADTAAPEATGPRKFPFDPKKLTWPSPPNIARIRWVDYFAGMKIDYTPAEAAKAKASWMDRLAGSEPDSEKVNSKTFPFQLIGPYGVAFDSKGLVYVADQRVGAVFIFNLETHETQMIRNGIEAHFGWINCVAVDDDDRLFVSDAKLHRVLIFNPKHELESQITEGVQDPVGLAIDTENRFLYVVDTQQDQVIVYDADTLKLLRRIGTGGKNHFLTTQGDFAAPQGIALDQDGNVYVTDTLNNRVETFDADGKFISMFGKNGDGPGYFARPKGIAVDSDGHIWVADEMQDRLQVFNREGQLLTYIGQGHGDLPGQFKSLIGVAIDKQNRVFTTEQVPGRVQVFQYVTDEGAAAEKARREKEAAEKHKPVAQATLAKPAESPQPNPSASTAAKDSPAPKGPGE